MIWSSGLVLFSKARSKNSWGEFDKKRWRQDVKQTMLTAGQLRDVDEVSTSVTCEGLWMLVFRRRHELFAVINDVKWFVCSSFCLFLLLRVVICSSVSQFIPMSMSTTTRRKQNKYD